MKNTTIHELASMTNTDPHTLRRLVDARSRALIQSGDDTPINAVFLWSDCVGLRYMSPLGDRAPVELISHEEFIRRYPHQKEESRYGRR